MNQDMKKVVEYVGGEPVVKFVKGDAPGHEFHGNQYTGGGKVSEYLEAQLIEHYKVGKLTSANSAINLYRAAGGNKQDADATIASAKQKAGIK